MTKNQINYLLALLTLFVLWFYFNTFYMDMKMQKRMNSLGMRPAAGMMNPTGQSFSPNMGGIPSQPNYNRQALPPEAQRMMENWRAARRAKTLPGATPAAAPVTAKQDKTQTPPKP